MGVTYFAFAYFHILLITETVAKEVNAPKMKLACNVNALFLSKAVGLLWDFRKENNASDTEDVENCCFVDM